MKQLLNKPIPPVPSAFMSKTLEVGHLTQQMEHFVVLLMPNTF